MDPRPHLIVLLFIADAIAVAALFALLGIFLWGTP